MNLEINYRKNNWKKTPNTSRLNNMLLDNKWVKKKMKEGIKRYMETKTETQQF